MDTLTVNHLSPTTVLVTGPEALLEWREDQKLLVPGHQYTPQFKRHQWDGYYSPGTWCRRRPGNIWEMRCSRGLVGRLAASFRVVTEGEPNKHHLTPRGDKLDDLRDYQKEAMLAAMQHQWGRIALATNAGKGAIIALLAEAAAQQDVHVLILCDELAVFDALEGELLKWTGCTPGQVARGAKLPPNDTIVLAMVPTLAKRIGSKDEEVAYTWRRWIGKRGMLLLDEADKATAAGWRKIITSAKNSHWRLGFSGSFPNPTEHPYDDLRLDELMGPILIQAKNIDLIEKKVSAIPLVTLRGFDATNTLRDTPSRWWEMQGASRRQLVFERAVVTNDARHQFIETLIRPDTSTAIVVNRIQHGKELEKTIAGAVFLDGSSNTKERLAVLEDFQAGKIKVLILTKILDRGTNRLGHTSDLLFVSGEGSTRQTLQRIGRGLRRTGGKEYLRLVDIIDRVELSAIKRGWLTKAADYIHTAARKRISLYRAEGFEVELIP